MKKISPIASRYNQLNCLPHLSAFGKAYAISAKPKYARIYIHDLENWMCDNSLPDKQTVLPGPWYPLLAKNRLNDALIKYISLFANSKDISNYEFFFLINTVQKHKEYLKVTGLSRNKVFKNSQK